MPRDLRGRRVPAWLRSVLVLSIGFVVFIIVLFIGVSSSALSVAPIM